MKTIWDRLTKGKTCSLCYENLQKINKIFYPPYSYQDNNLYLTDIHYICYECLQKLDTLSFLTNKFTHNFDNLPQVPVIYTGSYKGYLKDLIIRLKYFKERELAIPLGKLMAVTLMKYHEKSSLKNIFLSLPYDYIVPVPLHKERLLDRGFNQSFLLAKVLSKELDIPLLELVNRSKETSPLKDLSKEGRQNELSLAFTLNSKKENNSKSRILIIDDIITTGSTILEITKVLEKSGCKNITALTVSH
ncbi:ComF family protein [Natranaerobius trueperi]|uniref:Phosphoribosyltransferase domain-containing protein n=1 Tax=Natranaerobius trueperi TaxID=759412 RepID=A0A226C0N0_9FIRM|nr:phosphoribosyltransferase family protein [Natranaerobius trueperi]OWZ84858.1 hypothetical protein CDO51_00170 [Natranaerobius trueperi]